VGEGWGGGPAPGPALTPGPVTPGILPPAFGPASGPAFGGSKSAPGAPGTDLQICPQPLGHLVRKRR